VRTAHSLLVLAIAAYTLAAGCGARTGLRVDDDETDGEGGTDEGGGGAGEGGAPLGGGGAGGAGGTGGEGGMPPECEPGALLVYLVSSANNLYSYKPSDGALQVKGSLECDFSGPTPFSMGVDRTGMAYVLYNDGNLYRVKTADASCTDTDFVPGQLDFTTFGMGFARNVETESDELFVSEITFGGEGSEGLGKIDTETLELSFVGAYDSSLGDHMEMTSSSDGNLYGYSLDPSGGGWVVEIDKTNADILEATFLPVGDQASALAFAFWNDDFYIFTSDGVTTDVTRYRPADGSVALVQQINDVIVGAGVSTCDPM
jgi:hypothetical protein